ncbi:MAG: hypothetical protein WCG48_04280 [Candidatus Berkelbacteria bacterium]
MKAWYRGLRAVVIGLAVVGLLYGFIQCIAIPTDKAEKLKREAAIAAFKENTEQQWIVAEVKPIIGRVSYTNDYAFVLKSAIDSNKRFVVIEERPTKPPSIIVGDTVTLERRTDSDVWPDPNDPYQYSLKPVKK